MLRPPVSFPSLSPFVIPSFSFPLLFFPSSAQLLSLLKMPASSSSLWSLCFSFPLFFLLSLRRSLHARSRMDNMVTVSGPEAPGPPLQNASSKQEETHNDHRGRTDNDRETRKDYKRTKQLQRDTQRPRRDTQWPRRDTQRPLRDATAPERDATALERHATAPEREATAPERHATAPDRDATAPERHATAPERDATAPERHTGDVSRL